MKGYRTLALNSALVVAPLVEYLANDGVLVQAVMGAHAPVVLSAIGLINIVLRLVTTTPVAKAE